MTDNNCTNNEENTTPNDALKEVKHRISTAATDSIHLQQTCLDDLGTLFKAIYESSEKHSQTRNLAKIGRYLTCDWSQLCEESIGGIEEAMEGLK